MTIIDSYGVGDWLVAWALPLAVVGAGLFIPIAIATTMRKRGLDD